jgi:hypothetical protein
MVTSKSESADVFFCQVVFLLKSSDCFAFMMMAFSFSVISSYCEANASDSFRSSSDKRAGRFTRHVVKPLDYCVSIFPLVYVGRFDNFGIDPLKDLLADNPDFKF